MEDQFRLSNDDDLVSVIPLRHWTDSKIRCHLFTCVVALTYLRRLERKLRLRSSSISINHAMEEMRQLHSVLSVQDARRKPNRIIEQPTKTQAEVLAALGHQVTPEGVLHPISR